MRSKEEIALLWIIASIGIIIMVAIEPAIVLVALFAYAIISLWKHYTKGIR
tara:strand:+ start:1037 stop:1189 length:153 start_codon:yes stop_codon:yes gene_type:complete